jgi:hypothetical protein
MYRKQETTQNRRCGRISELKKEEAGGWNFVKTITNKAPDVAVV